MTTPTPPLSKYTQLGSLQISRILVGMWQISSPAWGNYPPKEKMVDEMKRYLDSGITTFDFADHYGPAELLFAAFHRSLPPSAPRPIGCTKWCPQPQKMSRAVVERAVRERCERMQVESLDLLQFHWWDYDLRHDLDEALSHLHHLHQSGLVRNLALTNFDTPHLTAFLSRGIPIVSNQVQFSLIDRRPEHSMAEICLKHNVKLLTYGTLCGGFISSRYLGVPDPLHSPHLTPSQRKYAQMINLWGGWELFQSLLSTLHRIAERKGPEFDISNIATRYILEKPYVGGVIIGARLGISEHIEQNLKVFEFELDGRDYSEIDEVLKRSNGERMFQVIGDCGDEYRG